MTYLLNLRKFWHATGTSLQFTLKKKIGTVGAGLIRNDEQGTVFLQFGFGSIFLSRGAWSWDAPEGFDEFNVSASIHNGKLWVYKGRIPWARPGGQHPSVYRLPWFEWKHREDMHHEQKRGEHPYTYQWKYADTVQHVTAKVSEDSRVWQLYFWKIRLPFLKRSHAIWCDFSEELGNERESWKGGTVGAGFKSLPGEAWQDTFARMQREMSFCRR